MEVSSLGTCGLNPNPGVYCWFESSQRRPSRMLGLGHGQCRSKGPRTSPVFAISWNYDRFGQDAKGEICMSRKPHQNVFSFVGRFTFSSSVSCVWNKIYCSGTRQKRHGTCIRSGTLTVVRAQNNSGEPSEENDAKDKSSDEDVGPQSTDWRAFRARLIANERVSEEEPSTSETKPENTPLGTRWAHPILKPEPGCVLIATDKLDELSIFERTVIILLSAGSNKANEGPFGLILNRPLPHVLKEIRPNDQALLDSFGDSQVHFGGPLVSDLILLLQAASARKGYQEVVPGILYSSADGLDQAVHMIKEKAARPDDFRFFFGYAGWGTGQLEREVEDGYWCVAACSTDLFISSSSANLWEETLKLMGGQYAELSKKPKKRWFK